MKKVTVLLSKKSYSLSTLINYYTENVNAQIFRTPEHECHGQKSVQIIVIALNIPDALNIPGTDSAALENIYLPLKQL